jgi:hypothetical protein
MTPELEANYRQLAADRGWTMGQMADSVEAVDPSTAAELRKLDAPKARRKRG